MRLSVNLETTRVSEVHRTLEVLASSRVERVYVRDGVFGRVESSDELTTDQEPFLLLGHLASRVPPGVGLGISVLRLDYRKTVVSARLVASFAALFPEVSLLVGAGWKRGLRTDESSADEYVRCIRGVERRVAGEVASFKAPRRDLTVEWAIPTTSRRVWDQLGSSATRYITSSINPRELRAEIDSLPRRPTVIVDVPLRLHEDSGFAVANGQIGPTLGTDLDGLRQLFRVWRAVGVDECVIPAEILVERPHEVVEVFAASAA